MKLIIPGSLCDLNTYINAERGNRYAGASLKKRETDLVSLHAKIQKLSKIVVSPAGMQVIISWFCNSQRKDPDNIAFAKKFILDGLVKAQIIPNDSWKYICSFTDAFYLDVENPRIEVEII